MAPLARFSAELLAEVVRIEDRGVCRILDVAAGHGLFGISLARRNPRAEVVAVDWPNVLEVADEFAAAAGITDRFRKIPGDAFRVDLGRDYDIVLLTNFLHHFDPPTCESFLRKVRGVLKPGGRVVTLEIIPDENRTTPPEPATFSLVMLVTTPAGDAHTFAEYERMFANAGFERSELHQIPPSFQRVVISY
jgi:2-polyprenyl-3-methyl-5-hydroxy-6-metoxy-1,4-benzoquinol methylase